MALGLAAGADVAHTTIGAVGERAGNAPYEDVVLSLLTLYGVDLGLDYSQIYPLSKMLSLAFDGITSLSVKPIRFITGFGVIVALISFIGVIWAIVEALLGATVSGWASMTSIICFVSGVQLICLGVIGEYIGKIYMETKARPRYIISERTWAPYERKYHG